MLGFWEIPTGSCYEQHGHQIRLEFDIGIPNAKLLEVYKMLKKRRRPGMQRKREYGDVFVSQRPQFGSPFEIQIVSADFWDAS